MLPCLSPFVGGGRSFTSCMHSFKSAMRWSTTGTVSRYIYRRRITQKNVVSESAQKINRSERRRSESDIDARTHVDVGGNLGRSASLRSSPSRRDTTSLHSPSWPSAKPHTYKNKKGRERKGKDERRNTKTLYTQSKRGRTE